MDRENTGTGRIVVLVLPHVNLLDLAGPVQVFDTAAHLGAPYRIEYAAESAQVSSAQGLRLAELVPPPPVGAGDLVLVPGPSLGPRSTEPLVSEGVAEWLRTAHRARARIASVCTGAAALGEAGLLDGRRCTTHWSLIDPMRERYPRARVREAVLYVHDGLVSTSAGVAAGTDLALSLVEREHGPEMACAVARQLVVYLRRDGSSGQVSPFLRHRDHLDPAVHRVQDHLARHPDSQETLADLAATVNLSPRGLSRAFTAATGITPMEYRQRLRLEYAGTLLRETDLTIATVAARCGFRDPRHFRRLFRTRHGFPPSEVRRSAP
ncbi:GlxA family transcriptional regulator [Nocardiopsis lambiniae]|uniref:GlxA family transcriptional regulator n=1 Tax=Nocardiopsis lambiniae TaxID=3075539 RepID=A0ABU2M7R5_9ACTN|nr:GlxA family transcriptional regulator [Nocardiopsis sp. DSM 44743]MDT0328572.1 GlxA family transcriptional regulator [Nocardiopsis sp. DSM 44743]